MRRSAQMAPKGLAPAVARPPPAAAQLGGSGTFQRSPNVTMPGMIAQVKRPRHPYIGSRYAESSAAHTYPTDQPACNMPRTVVLTRVGTYSAASSVPIL